MSTMTPRPCVCGGTPVVQESAHTPGFWHVFCPECGCHHQDYGHHAVDEWNRDMERGEGMYPDRWRGYVRLCNDR